MKILILGVTGMLGSTTFKFFTKNTAHEVYGSLRNISGLNFFDNKYHSKLFSDVDVLDHDSLINLFEKVRPDIVINCIGLIKQLSDADDPLLALPINAMLPHRLARLCSMTNARLILISTDCVFSGAKGLYVESDVSDAEDLYGKSKYIGEINNLDNVITIRTSIIGHEFSSNLALVDWFLSQSGTIKGYSNAVFSGLPTIELAKVIGEYIITNSNLHGLYHVSLEPINKYSLLQLVAKIYEKDITIIPDEILKIDRSLNSKLFCDVTGYEPPGWYESIKLMYESR